MAAAQRRGRAPSQVAAAAAMPVAAGVGAACPDRFLRPPSWTPKRSTRRSPPRGDGGSLAAVAKAASMKAERAAIEQTLGQVHWNRRKAAQILGVSYKTLLNKIKECGISRA